MHPSYWSRVAPEKSAIIMAGTGEHLSYLQLNNNSNRVAQLLRSKGLKRGDGIAIFMENNLAFMEICWGAQRSGLYFTPVSWHSTAEELKYILENSGARALFVSSAFEDMAFEVAQRCGLENLFVVGGDTRGKTCYEICLNEQLASPVEDESPGREMLYSSGSTGRPKGVKQPLPEGDLTYIQPAMAWLSKQYFFDADTINLTPAPLYHAGPLRYSLCVAHAGGTNIIMEKFDVMECLKLMEKYRVTHTEMVPTMMIRLAKLDVKTRGGYDLSSLKLLAHGTGPCPLEIKRDIIQWLGPIVEEQYGGTEGNGLCAISSKEWLLHPGSVGKAVLGKLHIVAGDSRECKPMENGLVYFEGGPKFEYHGEPEKTASAYINENWSTLGDIGYVDLEGYLYLTDRQSDMIISGGVNIYPREVENILINHPGVMDVAVFGVPHEDLGEQVIAVVQPIGGVGTEVELVDKLMTYCRGNLSKIKCPKSINLVANLPRMDSGKIIKSKLRKQFMADLEEKVVL